MLFNANTMRILKLISLMVTFTHWNACVQFMIPVMRARDGLLDPSSWPVRAEIAACPSCDPAHEDAFIGMQYVVALFNAFSQMLCIGYGVVPPRLFSEYLTLILSMLLGATLYGFFVASLTSFVADTDASSRLYSSKLDMVNQYMRHQARPRRPPTASPAPRRCAAPDSDPRPPPRVPPQAFPSELRSKIRLYLRLCFPHKRSFNEADILRSLTLPLRQQVPRTPARARPPPPPPLDASLCRRPPHLFPPFPGVLEQVQSRRPPPPLLRGR